MKIFVPTKPRAEGFSLIEVVVAVGIFAISIVAVIGLLGPTNKSISEVRDTDDATRVVNAIQSQLQTMAEGGKFNSTTVAPIVFGVGSSAATLNDGYIQSAAPADPADGATLANSTTYNKYTLYASKDGLRIGLVGDALWTSNDQKYFEVMLIRNTALSPNSATNADTTSGYLAYTIRLRWPAFMGNGTEFTAHTQKSVLLVPAAIHR